MHQVKGSCKNAQCQTWTLETSEGHSDLVIKKYSRSQPNANGSSTIKRQG